MTSRGKSESVDLSHFDATEAPIPSRLDKRRDQFADLARFGTSTAAGRSRQTPIACRKRPRRRACGGLLVVRRRDLPPAVEWSCPQCGAAGGITGWEDTDADLRQLAARTTPPERGRIAISVKAHRVLREIARSDSKWNSLVYSAEVEDDVPVLVVSDDERERFGAEIVRLALTGARAAHRDLLAEVAYALDASRQDPSAVDGFIEVTDDDLAQSFIDAVFGLEDAAPPQFVPARARPRPRSTRRRADAAPATFRIKVTLRDVKPPVWRRLVVPSSIELPMLHEVLQAAMGWSDCHLHLFSAGDRAFTSYRDDIDPVGEDSTGVELRDLAPNQGSRIVYEYDFGDGWTHDIVVEEVIDGVCEEVRCLTGRRRCPPEDCGGPWGYAEFREALADPKHERHEEYREWIGGEFDPDEFDVVGTDAAVRSLRP